MMADQAVAQYYLSPEKYAEHFTNRKAGISSFDIV